MAQAKIDFENVEINTFNGVLLILSYDAIAFKKRLCIYGAAGKFQMCSMVKLNNFNLRCG